TPIRSPGGAGCAGRVGVGVAGTGCGGGVIGGGVFAGVAAGPGFFFGVGRGGGLFFAFFFLFLGFFIVVALVGRGCLLSCLWLSFLSPFTASLAFAEGVLRYLNQRGRAASIIVFDHSCSYTPLIAST